MESLYTYVNQWNTINTGQWKKRQMHAHSQISFCYYTVKLINV